MSKVSDPCSPELKACVDALIAKGKPEDSAWAICRVQLGESLHPKDFQHLTLDGMTLQLNKWIKELEALGSYSTPPLSDKDFIRISLESNIQALKYAIGDRMVKKSEAYRHRDFQTIYNEFQAQYPTPKEAEQQYYSWIQAIRADETKSYSSCLESYLWKKEDIQFIQEDAENKYYEVEVGFPTRSMNGNVYSKRDLIAASLTLKGKSPSLNHKDEFWFSPKNPDNKWGNIEIVDGKFHENRSKALIKVPKNMVCPVCNGGLMTELIDKKQIYNVSLEGDCKGGQCASGECEGFVYGDPPFTLLTTDVLPGVPMTQIKPLESIMVEALHVNETKTEKKKVKTLEAKIIKPKEADSPGDVQGGECPEGFHKNEAGLCVKTVPIEDTAAKTAVGTSPAELLDEKVARIKAEDKATKGIKYFEEQALTWEKRFRDSEAIQIKQTGTIEQQAKTIEKLEKQVADRDLKVVEDGRKLADREDRLKDAILSRDDYKVQLEKLKTEHEILGTKYSEGLKTNLELSRKLTLANEDYLKVAKDKDDAEEALKRSKIQAKKIIRIQA